MNEKVYKLSSIFAKLAQNATSNNLQLAKEEFEKLSELEQRAKEVLAEYVRTTAKIENLVEESFEEIRSGTSDPVVLERLSELEDNVVKFPSAVNMLQSVIEFFKEPVMSRIDELEQLSVPAQSEESFAEKVRRAAMDPKTIKFGDRKAFIASVYDTYNSMFEPMSRNDFDAALIQNHLDGDIRMARADLVPAMDRNLVDRSEIPYQNATFHFIEV